MSAAYLISHHKTITVDGSSWIFDSYLQLKSSYTKKIHILNWINLGLKTDSHDYLTTEIIKIEQRHKLLKVNVTLFSIYVEMFDKYLFHSLVIYHINGMFYKMTLKHVSLKK